MDVTMTRERYDSILFVLRALAFNSRLAFDVNTSPSRLNTLAVDTDELGRHASALLDEMSEKV